MHEAAGLIGLWTQTDWLGRGVIVTLLVMSVASWWVIVVKALRLLALRRLARHAGREFWRAQGWGEGLALLGGSAADNPFRALAEAGQEAVQHQVDRQPGLSGGLDLGDWVEGNLRRGLDEAAAQMQSGLGVLASIGATAPFVGLLGTVWGIYHALVGLAGSSDAPTLDRVAGPVGEALVMTAFGLLVAIPAVLAYNALLRGNKAVLLQLRHFAHDLHAWFVTGARVGGRHGEVGQLPPQPRREEA
jgi:biopolymer transport protein ExbB